MSRADLEAIRELSVLRHRLRRALERVLLAEAGAPLTPQAGLEPGVDIWEDAERLVIEIEVPGADPDTIDLSLNGRDLTVSGEVKAVQQPGATYLRVERPRGRFARRLALPAEVTGTPKAVLSAGVLVVTLAKRETRRQIPIEARETGS